MRTSADSLRAAELEILRALLTPDGPWAVVVHGIGGVGKSTLLRSFAQEAEDRGRSVVQLDCGAIEPTRPGFLRALADALPLEDDDLDSFLEHVESLESPLLLVLDGYEHFRLLDAWLRQRFLPASAGRVHLAIASRDAPSLQWASDPTVGERFRSLRLETLRRDQAMVMLDALGVDRGAQESLVRIAHGHPLALRLAASARADRVDPRDQRLDTVLAELTRFFVADIDDRLLRAAVEAMATVRRVHVTTLAAMLDLDDATALYEELGTLHFVEGHRDGSRLHDAVRQFVASELQSRDPCRFAAYRRAAWRQLRREIRQAPAAQLWRYTADLIYLIENPVIREAFFPSGDLYCAVEPALPDDVDHILEISALHEPPEATRLLEFWWERMADAFYVARGDEGDVLGFYCSLDSDRARHEDLFADPVTRVWQENLVEKGSVRALFLRRWLSRVEGERPSAVQAACWLDLKRSYLELRPRLRRVYLTLRNPQPYLAVASRLGFMPMAQTITLGDAEYASAVLDFGPRSVDGWMSRLLTHELGELGPEQGAVLDLAAHQLISPDGRIDLSPLEFGVLRLLVENEGEAVSRAELLADVWDIHHEGSSNVVDTVVRGIRTKLGSDSHRIESVRGVGYRYQPPPVQS